MEPGTPEMEAVQAVLEQHAYHLCLGTFVGGALDWRLNLNGKWSISLSDVNAVQNDHASIYFADRGKDCCVRTRWGLDTFPIVRMDYWGEERGTGLCGELAAAVGIE